VPVSRGAGAGVEETAQFSRGEVATAAFRLPAYSRHADRRLELLAGHQLGVPALSKHTAQRGEHAVGGGRLVVLLEQAPDLEHVRPTQPLPGHGLRSEDLSGATGNPVQGGELRSPGRGS
jgi:hypothetical protein